MRTLQENLETVEDCRSRKYENSVEYEPEEMSAVEHIIEERLQETIDMLIEEKQKKKAKDALCKPKRNYNHETCG